MPTWCTLSPDFVTKRHDAIRVCLHLEQMQGDVSGEPLKERNALTDDDRDDGITHFVGQSEAQALRGHRASANEPDVPVEWFQLVVHQDREVACVELDGGPRLR